MDPFAEIDNVLDGIFSSNNDEDEDRHDFVGHLVQISGLGRPVAIVSAFQTGEVPPADVNGAYGLCSHHVIGTKYAVETFDGFRVEVKEENLKEYHPPSGADSGFDALWPSASFEEDVVNSLQARGFCVVQTFAEKITHVNATIEAQKLMENKAFKDYSSDVQGAILGLHNATGGFELTSLERDALPLDSSLTSLDDTMSQMMQSISESASANLDINCWGRSPALLRKPRGPDDPAKEGSSEPATKRSLAEVASRPFTSQEDADFFLWLRQRKLCVMCFVDGEGGSLELKPISCAEGKVDVSAATIPVVTGRAVIFRHDYMNYSYEPTGTESLAMQAWLMSEPEELEVYELPSHPMPQLGVLHVMAAMERFPAGCFGADKVWTMFVGGTDAQIEIPAARFDYHPYYMEDPNAGAYNKTDTKHGAFLDYDHMVGFNNKIFDISDEEARYLEIGQRWILESGYDCLRKAGYTKKSLLNANIGTFLGDYGSEWKEAGVYRQEDTWQWNNASLSNAGHSVGRLAHCLGLRGPQLHVDTACSASLVGLNAAAKMMRWDQLGHPPDMRSAVCLGIVCFLNPAGWIGQTQAHMLSPRGRCFTFDATADGQNRGEGCSCVNIQSCLPVEQDEMDDRGRLGTLAGCSSNQDGKSASLTAPSGPAQQELHRLSLREAQISGALNLMGECHGTGTPLGDAIEYGANRAVFGVAAKGDRIRPHLLVSSKAHLAHLEPAAGVCGLLKVVMTLLHACTTPNPHLTSLNPNFELDGYPHYFGNELVDLGSAGGFGGVASFAFGGSNARGDVWARPLRGPRSHGKKTRLSKAEGLRWIKDAQELHKFHDPIHPKLKIGFESSVTPFSSDVITVAGSF